MLFSVRGLGTLLCVAVLSAACQTPPPPPPPVEGLTAGQVEALKFIGFEEGDEGWELNLGGRILFGRDDASLNETGRETVANVVRVLIEAGIDHLRIEGYADNTGTERRNHELSLQRAEVVAREAEKSGLPYANITLHAGGTSNPVASNQTRQGRAQNRRVVLIVPIR
jgi:outer membrane protein OmpA-like peptidoglycan-associated protein